MNGTFLKEIEALFDENVIGSLANIASAIYHEVKDLNWVGYYFIKDRYLYLGPFSGKVACSILTLDKGVCAKAVRDRSVTYIKDVHAIEDHIACDSASASELVLPLYKDKKVIGVLDIDAPITDRFAEFEIELFKDISSMISTYLEAHPPLS